MSRSGRKVRAELRSATENLTIGSFIGRVTSPGGSAGSLVAAAQPFLAVEPTQIDQAQDRLADVLSLDREDPRVGDARDRDRNRLRQIDPTAFTDKSRGDQIETACVAGIEAIDGDTLFGGDAFVMKSRRDARLAEAEGEVSLVMKRDHASGSRGDWRFLQEFLCLMFLHDTAYAIDLMQPK